MAHLDPAYALDPNVPSETNAVPNVLRLTNPQSGGLSVRIEHVQILGLQQFTREKASLLAVILERQTIPFSRFD